MQAAVAGIGAAVVGLLAAALWDPVLRTSVDNACDALFALVLFGLLRVLPPVGRDPARGRPRAGPLLSRL